MAFRNNTNTKKPPPKSPVVIIFWLIFFIVVICLFLAKREVIAQNIQNLFRRPETEENEPPEVPVPAPEAPVPVPGGSPPVSAPSGAAETEPVSPPVSEGRNPPETVRPGTPQPAGTGAPPGPEAGRNRTLYFMQLDRDGTIIRTKVQKTLPVSDSPMLDILRSLLQGPSAEEQRRGFISLIPQGTRIINATVRGETAYINFSEEFQYNTYGVEGYAAQLKQVVWTATEFSNVKDVQVLIEGRRVDYLGESVWIGSPINRDIL
ncbi:MAG: GerMN domain-containing protein [Treponema sp.]|nr:GerMN domain-containing protein [Treponema sp.]